MQEMETEEKKLIHRVELAVEAIKRGGMVIMVDDEDRENEGDLVLAAETITPEQINFLAKEARGLICLTLDPDFIDRLKLPMMADSTKHVPAQGTAFTVSIEAKQGVSTGISAADRAHTILTAVKDEATPDDIVVPGHIFPLKARKGGVLERAGHTEGSVDIAKLAGLKGAGVICEIMKDDGTMARMPDLEEFAKTHDIPIVAIADLIHYRLMHDCTLQVIGEKMIRTQFGVFNSVAFRSTIDQTEHLAIIKGHDLSENLVDVRVHSQHPLIDAIADSAEGGRFRIEYGLKLLSQVSHGVFVYLSRLEGSILDEIQELHEDYLAFESREFRPPSAQSMDVRLHGIGAQILRSLGVRQMRIHTRSPLTLKALSGFGLEIIDTHLIK